MLRQRRIIELLFLILSLIILGNLNGVGYMLGVNRLFSPLILATSVPIIILLEVWDRQKSGVALRVFLVFFVLYLYWGLFSSLFNQAYNKDLVKIYRVYLSSLIIIYAFYKYTIYAHKNGELIRMMGVVTFFMFCAVSFTVLASYFGWYSALSFQTTHNESRSAGLFVNPNEAGLHGNFTLVFLLFFYQRAKRFGIFLLPAILITLLAIVLSFSKTAIITSTIIFLFFLFISYLSYGKIRKPFRINLISGILIFIVFSVAASYTTLKENATSEQRRRMNAMEALVQGKVTNEVTTKRSMLFENGIDLIFERPLTGYGISYFKRLPKYGEGIHNTYLLILGDTGLLVFGFFILFLATMLWQGWFIKSPDFQFFTLAIMLALILIFMSAHYILQQKVMNALLGIVLGILHVERKRKITLE